MLIPIVMVLRSHIETIFCCSLLIGYYFLGKFDAKDLVNYFQKLNIQLDEEEARKLVKK